MTLHHEAHSSGIIFVGTHSFFLPLVNLVKYFLFIMIIFTKLFFFWLQIIMIFAVSDFPWIANHHRCGWVFSSSKRPNPLESHHIIVSELSSPCPPRRWLGEDRPRSFGDKNIHLSVEGKFCHVAPNSWKMHPVGAGIVGMRDEGRL